jgi:putative ABC transport system permease protein
VGWGLVPVAVGTLVGVGAAILLAKLAAGFLYGVSATDPPSIALAAVVLLFSGTLAAMVPAWRAARVSPVESLRSD